MSIVIQNCSRYLIDSRWFKQWKKYVGFDSWDMYNVGERSLFPGPVDNSGLFSGTVVILTFELYAFAFEDNAQLRLTSVLNYIFPNIEVATFFAIQIKRLRP